MGIFFSILSPAIFGINNCIDKFLLQKHNISPVVISIYGGVFAFIFGLILLVVTGFFPIDVKSLLIIVTSGFLTTIYLLPYYKALFLDEASNVIPLFQFCPIFVLVMSFIFLHESLSIMQYIGCIIIILAGFLLSVDKLSGKIFKLRKSFFYMLLSSFLIASALVLYKFSVQTIPFWNTLPYEGFGIALGGLAIFLFKNNKKAFLEETRGFKKRVFVFMTINEIVYIISRYTGYFAISLISVGIVSILSGFQPLFVLLYGIILSLWFPKIMKETINKRVLFQKFMS